MTAHSSQPHTSVLPPVLEPGDIILTQGNSWLSRMIRRFERAPGEGPALVNHAGICVCSPDIIVEALEHVERHSYITKYVGSGHKMMVFRPRDLNPVDQRILIHAAEHYIGDSYGWWKLLGHLGDAWLSSKVGREIYLLRRLFFLDRYPICSYLVAQAESRIGRDFGVPANEADPDDIYDYCVGHPEKYELVFELQEIRRD